jgi:hypothetical protein
VRRHFVTPNEWHLVDDQARGITKVESFVLMRTVENHRKIKYTSRADIAMLGCVGSLLQSVLSVLTCSKSPSTFI